ncbi:hypothetical protein E4Z66_07655 [Aliishimia ponticola]|uniref:YrhK domain-containing protein n=1 Tax=Aliishimia ponticola TaxID=2499833 RepID=A0A4S4NBN4_9RHOB|nr:hypothetical protein E4Z66_07655 [Aliishimia ponticola]
MAKRGFFWPDRSGQSESYQRRYAAYELVYTLVDFLAALLFVVGSVLFFFESYQTPATWCFLVGSIFFAAKPTIRLIREVRLAEHGEVSELAGRLSPGGSSDGGKSGQSGRAQAEETDKSKRPDQHK